jgi:polyferredoxin
VTHQPSTRASERIARRKELRQARLAEAQRRRSQRARLRIVIAVIILMLIGLLAWFAVAVALPPAAVLGSLPPLGVDGPVTTASLQQQALHVGKESWLEYL